MDPKNAIKSVATNPLKPLAIFDLFIFLIAQWRRHRHSPKYQRTE